MQEEQAQYAEALEGAGVAVHWIDWGEAPMSAFGPMQAMWAPLDLWVIRGGSIIQKTGWHPFSFGRSEFLGAGPSTTSASRSSTRSRGRA